MSYVNFEVNGLMVRAEFDERDQKVVMTGEDTFTRTVIVPVCCSKLQQEALDTMVEFEAMFGVGKCFQGNIEITGKQTGVKYPEMIGKVVTN